MLHTAPVQAHVAPRHTRLDLNSINQGIRDLGLVVSSFRDGELALNFTLSNKDVAKIDFETFPETVLERLRTLGALTGVRAISIG